MKSAQEEPNVIVLRSVFTTSPTPFALHHPVPRPPTPAAPPFHHLNSSSGRRSRSRRSLCICALVCGLLSLDVFAVVDGDPAAGGEPDPVDEGDGDEGDDEEGGDDEDGFHAGRRGGGLGDFLMERGGEKKVRTYFVFVVWGGRRWFEMDVRGWGLMVVR